jgi:hypothetical protein
VKKWKEFTWANKWFCADLKVEIIKTFIIRLNYQSKWDPSQKGPALELFFLHPQKTNKDYIDLISNV